MAKKITIYVPDELSLYTWKEIVQLAKKGLSDTVESSVPSVQVESSDILWILEKIYEDTQVIVDAIQKKKVSDKVESKDEKLTMSKLRWQKWLNYKAHRDAWGSYTDSWWIDFDELLTKQPYKSIKAWIDRWEYIED